jgi:hypothetical protein
MSIPNSFDTRLGAIADGASSIQGTLMTMRYASQGDRDRLRRSLRERLQDYVVAVMGLADDAAQ